MRSLNFTSSEISLILSNTVVLFLIVTSGVDPKALILVYWAESAVIGFFAILRLIVNLGYEVKGSGKQNPAKIMGGLFTIPFFTVHFGGFMFGHLIFLVALFLRDADILALLWAITLPAAALFTSHLISFYKNFLKKKEYASFSGGRTQNILPYHRIFLMHVLIIFIGAAEQFIPFFPSGTLFAVILTTGKTWMDLLSHRREHKKLSQ